MRQLENTRHRVLCRWPLSHRSWASRSVIKRESGGMEVWTGEGPWGSSTGSSSTDSDSGDEQVRFFPADDSDFSSSDGSAAAVEDDGAYESPDGSAAADAPWTMPDLSAQPEVWQQAHQQAVRVFMSGVGPPVAQAPAYEHVHDWYAEEDLHSEASSSGYTSDHTSGAGDFLSDEDGTGSTSDGTMFDDYDDPTSAAALEFTNVLPAAHMVPLPMSAAAATGHAAYPPAAQQLGGLAAQQLGGLAPTLKCEPLAVTELVVTQPARARPAAPVRAGKAAGVSQAKAQTGAGATCPLCVRPCQDNHRLGVFWRKFGYEGPPYCSVRAPAFCRCL